MLYNDITAVKNSEIQESQNSEYALVLQLYVDKNIKIPVIDNFHRCYTLPHSKFALVFSRVLKNDPQFQTNDWVNLAQVLIGFRANFHQQLMTETCDFKTQNHALIFYFSTVYPNFSHDAQDRAAFSEDFRSLELNPNRKGCVPRPLGQSLHSLRG